MPGSAGFVAAAGVVVASVIGVVARILACHVHVQLLPWETGFRDDLVNILELLCDPSSSALESLRKCRGNLAS